MLAGTVGQDELAAGELRDRRAERRVRRQRRVIDLMHHLQKFVRLQAVLRHQPAHGGAIALVIILLQPERLVVGDLQKIDDVVADAHVDLLPQVQVMRIKRVVEVEDPGLDVGETALGRAADGVIVHSRRLVVATVPGDEARRYAESVLAGRALGAMDAAAAQEISSVSAGNVFRHRGRRSRRRHGDPGRASLTATQPASRHDAAGTRPLSAPSCSRTGSRSPSMASASTERASSSGFTVVLPIAFRVSHASSNAASRTTSVWGSNELLWNPRIDRPHRGSPDTTFTEFVKLARELGRVCDACGRFGSIAIERMDRFIAISVISFFKIASAKVS